MRKLTYRPATVEDAVSLSGRLRHEDMVEVHLASGKSPEEVLVLSLSISEVAEAAVVDGEVIAIRGIGGGGGIGVPWLLCSPEVSRWSKRMVADAIPWVAHHLQRYQMLTNMVHAENTKAIQWLRRLGFTIGDLHPEWGAGKAPFHQFYMFNPNV